MGGQHTKAGDLALIDAVIAKLDELSADEPLPVHLAEAHSAFRDMRDRLTRLLLAVTLSDRQRAWVTGIGEQIEADMPPGPTAAEVPRGREVELKVGPLPKRPPGRPI